MVMFYRITKKFEQLDENPYFEDTRAWHTYIDICCTHNIRENVELNIDLMVKEHSQNHNYYDDTLLLFVEDGLLECVYELKKEK
jgi:hypothetical protein